MHPEDIREYHYINSGLHEPVYDYPEYRDYSSRGHTGSTSATPCAATTRLPVAPALLQLRSAPRLLVVQIAPTLLRLCRASGRIVSTLNFSSNGRTGSRRVPGHSVVRRDYPSRGRNGYTSLTPCVRVPRHVTRLVMRLVAPLVVDYFDYAACPGASACRAARHVAHRAAHHRLLCLRRASGCLGTSRDSSCGSSMTTPCAAISSCGHTGSTSATPCVATTCLVLSGILPGYPCKEG
jgi:hypothetical protein